MLNNALGLDGWTAYQVATKPAECKVWWWIPTSGPWQEIDLRKYFTNAWHPKKQNKIHE